MQKRHSYTRSNLASPLPSWLPHSLELPESTNFQVEVNVIKDFTAEVDFIVQGLSSGKATFSNQFDLISFLALIHLVFDYTFNDNKDTFQVRENSRTGGGTGILLPRETAFWHDVHSHARMGEMSQLASRQKFIIFWKMFEQQGVTFPPTRYYVSKTDGENLPEGYLVRSEKTGNGYRLDTLFEVVTVTRSFHNPQLHNFGCEVDMDGLDEELAAHHKDVLGYIFDLESVPQPA
ncbi:MAG TPA: hypothetical protein VLA04_01180 [Verrucomicrobiae bacterium]|nr:hypothetical protein [Verrucomicrobiae bacterium]